MQAIYLHTLDAIVILLVIYSLIKYPICFVTALWVVWCELIDGFFDWDDSENKGYWRKEE